MTLLTVDAKLMPVLPLIARPESKRALVVAFGMGSAFRAALIAGLHTEAVELVPSVPEMFGYYYPDAEAVLADPNGKVIVTDGRNHLELADERFDIIITDPPPPIESSGAVGHLVARVLRGRPGSPDRRRDHDAVAAVRRSRSRFQRPHPNVRRGLPGGHAGQGRGRLRRLHARVVAVRSPSTRPTSARSSAGPAS